MDQVKQICRYFLYNYIIITVINKILMSKFKQYTSKDKHQIQFLDTNNLTRYFSYNDLQIKIKPSAQLISNLKTIIKAQKQHLLGYQIFFDESINIKSPKSIWKYYVTKFKIQKDNLKSTIQTTCNLLNYIRMVTTYAKKSQDLFFDETVDQIIIRNVFQIQIQATSMKQITQAKYINNMFGKIIHCKIQQGEDELIVFLGFTDKYKQFIYLLLTFRQYNMRRLKLNPTISLGHIDPIIQHLILIMRMIVGENDFNLQGKQIKAVLQSCILNNLSKESIFNTELLIDKFNQNKRLLLLYQSNSAYFSIYNTTTDGQLSIVLEDQNLYKLLYKLLIHTKGLLIKNQQISYNAITDRKQNTQQLVTVISVLNKYVSNPIFYNQQQFVQLAIQKLIDFLDDTGIKNNKKNIFSQNIKQSIKILNTSRNIMKNRIQTQGSHLVAVPINPRIPSQHFYNQYARLQKVFKNRKINPVTVEQLIYKIRNSHKKKMQKINKNYKKQNRQKNPSKEYISLFYMTIAKTFKIISQNSQNIVNILMNGKQKTQILLNSAISANPYKCHSLIIKILKKIVELSLNKSYLNFLKTNSLQFCRNQLLYKFLFQIFKNTIFQFDFNRIDIQQQIIRLISRQGNLTSIYNKLLDKVGPIIFKKNNTKQFRLIEIVYKYIQEQIKKISTKDSIYSFLGSLYFQTIFGSKKIGVSKIQNSIYKTKNISELTNQIKKQKLIELLQKGGLNSQIYTIKSFFHNLNNQKQQEQQQNCYQIYKDFIFNHYHLEILIRAIINAPITNQIYPAIKFFKNDASKYIKIIQNQSNYSVFSFFQEDISNFQFNTELQRMSFTNDLNRTFTESQVVKDLFNLNPNTRLAGLQIKELFSTTRSVNRQDQSVLYDYDIIIQKVYGIKLMQAQQLLNIFYNLQAKYLNFNDLQLQQKSLFNKNLSTILDNESKLKKYVQRTIELELYLQNLQSFKL